MRASTWKWPFPSREMETIRPADDLGGEDVTGGCTTATSVGTRTPESMKRTAMTAAKTTAQVKNTSRPMAHLRLPAFSPGVRNQDANGAHLPAEKVNGPRPEQLNLSRFGSSCGGRAERILRPWMARVAPAHFASDGGV